MAENITALRDRLTGMLIGLARATEGNDHLLRPSTGETVVEGLWATHESTSEEDLAALIRQADEEKRKLVPDCYLCACPCGRTENFNMERLRNAPEDVQAMKLQLLNGIRQIAAAVHAIAAQMQDGQIHRFLYKGLFAIGMEDWGSDELMPILEEMEQIKNRVRTG